MWLVAHLRSTQQRSCRGPALGVPTRTLPATGAGSVRLSSIEFDFAPVHVRRRLRDVATKNRRSVLRLNVALRDDGDVESEVKCPSTYRVEFRICQFSQFSHDFLPVQALPGSRQPLLTINEMNCGSTVL